MVPTDMRKSGRYLGFSGLSLGESTFEFNGRNEGSSAVFTSYLSPRKIVFVRQGVFWTDFKFSRNEFGKTMKYSSFMYVHSRRQVRNLTLIHWKAYDVQMKCVLQNI